MKVINQTNGQELGTNVKKAYTFWRRFNGLMFTNDLPQTSGLHINPCRSIHTFFMKYAIDVVYIDAELKVVALEECVQPGQVGSVYKDATSVIELPTGTIAKSETQIGHVLELIHN